MVESAPRYRKLNTFLRRAFGRKVYRVGLWGGFTCPNRDGSLGTGGCVFCNPASSEPLGHIPGTPIGEQLASGIEYVRNRHDVDRFIAFFSDYSTTYADLPRLESMYQEALARDDVVGLALSTRPDCLGPEVLKLLARISGETFLWVELGVQSANDATLERIHRCHDVEASRAAIAELRSKRIAVSAHVILGLPGESAKEMAATTRFLIDTGVHSVKIHGLHVVEGTPLAAMYRRGEYRTMELEEYVDLVIRFLEQLPPSMIIQRFTAEAPRRLTVAPDWSVNKLAVMNAIENELDRRDTWQGRALGHAREELEVPVTLPGVPSSDPGRRRRRSPGSARETGPRGPRLPG
jgi:radical SAM protein (TIGR01212 family)